MDNKYIAYYRVSTKRQGASGLGLEAQRKAVQDFVKCTDCIIAEFKDVESGKADDRPELIKAIAAAKRHNVKLIIAKLDRLSRNAGFIFTLKDSGADFICADMPEANTLTIGIFATLAQHERELISERTKKALAAKKATGWKPGTPENLTYADRMRGVQRRKELAANHSANRQAKELIHRYRSEGMTFNSIANKLNDLGMRTRRGKEFKAMTVKRLA